MCGGLMIGSAAFLLVSIGIMIGNVWTQYQTEKALEEMAGMFASYMATATDDEYEEIAQSIRRDLVYSEYGQDIDKFLQYVPNTAEGCCLEQIDNCARANLILLNTGVAYGLDLFDSDRSLESQRESGGAQINAGYDEISQAQVVTIKDTGRDSGTLSINRGRGIVSVHKMKALFCDDCIREILDTVAGKFIDVAVIYDAVEKRFYPVTEGNLQIGDYSFNTRYVSGGYKTEIEYIGE